LLLADLDRQHQTGCNQPDRQHQRAIPPIRRVPSAGVRHPLDEAIFGRSRSVTHAETLPSPAPVPKRKIRSPAA
jgi:hypothetical protein